MQPEFVNHLVGVFTPNKSLSVTVWNISGNLFMKSTTVGWSQHFGVLASQIVEDIRVSPSKQRAGCG